MSFYGEREREKGSYETAQICLNGHVINSMAEKYPESNKKFCDECGEKTITQCPDCNAKIKGTYELPGVLDFSGYQKSSFCDNCGNPYPWTKRNQEAVAELIEFSEILNDKEKEDFKNSINDLIVQSPKTNTAVVKFKSYAKKAGNDIANGLKDIVIDIVSESVKKAIWGNA